ncbi:MAG: hypothetical protein IPM64_12870 [Phycisphaerales bacterium]|nr:hypothetical protein [Phycisphaerales bacterium]
MKASCWLIQVGLTAAIGVAALAQPPGDEAPPPPPPPGAEEGARGHGRPHRPALGDPLIRGLAQRNPELAARLARLRREDPEAFHQLMIDALVPQLEEALDAINAPPGEPPNLEAGAGPRPPRGPGMGPGPRGPGMRPDMGPGPRDPGMGPGPQGRRPPPGRPHGGPGDPPPHPGIDGPRPGMGGPPPHPGMDGGPDGFPPPHADPAMGGPPHGDGEGPHRDGRPPRPNRGPGMGPPPRMSEEDHKAEREFGERFEALRRDHANLEQEVRRVVREHGELPAEAQAQRTELRARLVELINAQFDARTRLREMEVERLRREVARIEKALAEIGAELQQRGADRERIIERRAEELLERGKAGR